MSACGVMDLGAASSRDYIVGMLTVLGLIGFVIVLGALVVAHAGKPERYDWGVFVPGDREATEANLRRAVAAWKAGKPSFISDYARQKIENDCAAACARPWPAEDFAVASPHEPERRLVRDHPMRPLTWK